MLSPYLAIYVIGVAIGLVAVRDRWPQRIVTSLVWPLGPIAFVVVVGILVIAAALLWPAIVVPGLAILAAIAWALT